MAHREPGRISGIAGPGPGQAGGGAKLVGNPPQVFDREWERTQLFLSQWEIYWGLNYIVDIMAQPYTRVLCWLREQVHGRHVLPNNPWLWAQMMVHFRNTFINTMTQAKACHELSKLRMEGGHIDEYVAKFKQYVTMAGYSVDEPTVLEKFIKGLPNPLAKTCVEMDTPDTWEEWKESASTKMYIYAGDKSSVSVTTKKISLHLKRKT